VVGLDPADRGQLGPGDVTVGISRGNHLLGVAVGPQGSLGYVVAPVLLISKNWSLLRFLRESLSALAVNLENWRVRSRGQAIRSRCCGTGSDARDHERGGQDEGWRARRDASQVGGVLDVVGLATASVSSDFHTDRNLQRTKWYENQTTD
jgi:hypothetical protein